MKTAEEILKKYVDETDLYAINTPLFVLAMEEYAKVNLREELIKYERDMDINLTVEQIEICIDEYLSKK